MSEPRTHAVVEASAGTGKTYTLEQLVVALVREGTPVERILVVTFTEKATREMRVRVRDRLAEGAAGDALVARALAGFDRAPISTIHGFCQRLLAEHAFTSGRTFEPSRVDGRVAFGRALRRALRAADADVLAVVTAALGTMELPDLEGCLFAFHRETCPVRPDASVSRVREALAQLPVDAAVEPIVQSVPHQVEQARVRAELPVLFALARRARTEPAADVLAPLLAWARVTEGPKSTRERTVVALAESLATHASLGEPLAELAELLSSPVPLLVHAVLPAVRAELAREKRDAGLFDYDDLLALVLESLRGPNGEALVRAVRARYHHALVDEFQDTDERQWEIFRRLFFDPLPDATATTLTVIGDPKQAIYGFRGADVHTYERACREMEAGGRARRSVLDRSYRTSGALLEAMHTVILPPTGESPFFTGVVRYDAPVRTARPALGVVDAAGATVPPLRVLHLVAQGELRMKPARRALAEAYAAEIEALLAGAVRVVDEKGAHTIGASDVFVLTRTAAEGDEVGDALRARGIAHTFFRKDGLFATDEAKDVFDVLRALVAPRDRRARLRAYVTAIFAVPLDRLSDAAELPPEHGVRRAFDRLLALSRQRELAPLLRAIADETGLVQRELYLHASERRLTNYLHVLDVLLGLSHRGGLSLRDLVDHLGELVTGRARPSEDEDVQRLPSERAAVQILTIHKAKGLEAEAVFLFGGLGQRPPSAESPVVLHGPASGTPEGRYAWAGPLPPAEKARFLLEDDEEAQRLYYVALTRAASLLYLPYVGPRAGEQASGTKLRGPYRVVNDQLRRLVRRGEAVDARLVERREIDVAERAVVRSAPAPMGAPAPAAAIPQVKGEVWASLRSALAGVEVTSYSRMKAGAKALAEQRRDPVLDDASAERDEEIGHTVDRAVRAPGELPGGPAVGVMIHEILEHLPLDEVRVSTAGELAQSETCLDHAREAADRNGLSHALVAPALELAIRALKTPVRGPGLVLPEGLATPTRRLVEVPFVHPIPERDDGAGAPVAIERGYVRGVVDLLFEHEDQLWVLDWKSDRLDDYDAPTMGEHVRASYEVQVRLYTLACVRMFGLATPARYEQRFGGLVYVFLRGLTADGHGTLFLRPSFTEVKRWEDDLRASDTPWGYPLPPRRGVPVLAAPTAASALPIERGPA